MSFTTHVTRSIDIPFTVTAPDGTPDTTTPVSASTASGAVRVGIRPDNNRVCFVDGLQQTAGANVVLTVTEGGTDFTTSFTVAVGPAPNRGSITASSTASAEYDTPASR